MPEPTIIKGSKHCFNVTYEGNGKGQRVGRFLPFTDNGTISKSCLFTDGDSSYLNRTSGTATSTKIFTVSVWARRANIGTHTILNLAPLSGTTNAPTINWGSSATIQLATSGGSSMNKITTRTFEDTSKWYHIVARFDTTQSTAADRVRLYVDGDQITDFGTNTIPSQNADFVLNSQVMQVGRATSGGSPTQYLDGFLAELHYADGQSYGPETFGVTDTSTGRWIPKSLGSITYGNNGFRLQFANSAGQTIGDDTSGNDNDFTVNNLDANDVFLDTPSDLFPTFRDYQGSYGGNYDVGNLRIDGSTNSQTSVGRSTLTFDAEDSTGYYWEVKNIENNGFGQNWNGYGMFGVDADGSTPSSGNLKPATGSHVTYRESGNILVKLGASGTEFDGGSAYFPKTGNNSSLPSGGDTIGVAVKSGNVWFAKNGNWINPKQGHPGLNGTPAANNVTGRFRAVSMCYHSTSAQEVNFGQRLTLGGTATSDYTANNGGRFVYDPPVGFRALKQDNLSEATNDFADLVWIKNRDQADGHKLFDSNRGVKKNVNSSSNGAEATIEDGLVKFLNGGCEIEDHVAVNSSAESYVSWNWHANGGTTAANTDGSGATLASTIQANQDAGFSIVTYAGSSSGAKTVAHGLSQIPEMIWIKNLTDSSRNWFVYQKNASYASMKPYDGNAAYYMVLNNSDARGSGNVFNNTAPTNKVFHIQDAGSLNTNGSGKNYIAYCWHSVEGYSKIGRYLGNGSSNGPMVTTGFKPSFLLVKCISPSSTDWIIWDNTRSNFNPCDNVLYPNLTQAETTTGNDMDFYANGFKPRGTNADYNTGSRNYFYMAFAKHPFIGDGTNPATAR